jgi:hypothetical protein
MAPLGRAECELLHTCRNFLRSWGAGPAPPRSSGVTSAESSSSTAANSAPASKSCTKACDQQRGQPARTIGTAASILACRAERFNRENLVTRVTPVTCPSRACTRTLRPLAKSFTTRGSRPCPSSSMCCAEKWALSTPTVDHLLFSISRSRLVEPVWSSGSSGNHPSAGNTRIDDDQPHPTHRLAC